jgi:hypothetical protein
LANAAGLNFAMIGFTYTVNAIGFISLTVPIGRYVTKVGKLYSLLSLNREEIRNDNSYIDSNLCIYFKWVLTIYDF